MISQLITILTNLIIYIISAGGYFGVGLLMALESACIPIPSEIIMPFAGYLVYSGRFSLFGIALAGGIGSSIGSVITYWIGMYGGRPFIERFGKYVLVSKHDLDIADRFFAKYGKLSTFIGRLLPVVRTFISIPAGIARVPFWNFLFYSFVGSFLWSGLLGYFGLKLGPEWVILRERAHFLDVVIIVVIVVGTVWWVWRHWAMTKMSRNEQE